MTTSLYRNPSDVPKSSPLVITQGTFDGVHLGHQKVLKHVVDLAKEQNTQSLLITYHPHPRLGNLECSQASKKKPKPFLH